VVPLEYRVAWVALGGCGGPEPHKKRKKAAAGVLAPGRPIEPVTQEAARREVRGLGGHITQFNMRTLMVLDPGVGTISGCWPQVRLDLAAAPLQSMPVDAPSACPSWRANGRDFRNRQENVQYPRHSRI
jgi:hypothetical protein